MRPEAHNLPKQHLPKLLPDFSVDDVLDIDFAELKKLGVKHLLFDLDLTLRNPHANELEASIITYLTEERAKHGFASLDLATNNMRDLSRFSEPLSARVFQPFRRGVRLVRKPNPAYFTHILRQLDAQPQEVAMIGDKALFDVAGGNVSGMLTILVAPRGEDPLHDKVLFIRFREKRLLKKARAALALAKAAHTS